ncbi:MAG: MBL fold metallo-hydrolase, partial [Candidatus Woesearchaeota archaeon]
MNVSVIASGSNGNSSLVEDKDTLILIDAGKTIKEIEDRLHKMGKSLENLNAVLLTHGHIDHYMSVGEVSRKYNVTVFMTKKTHGICKGGLRKTIVKYFRPNQNFMVGNLLVEPVETSHDIPCTGFRIGKFGLFTDTGIVTKEMKKVISKIDGIILESNH